MVCMPTEASLGNELEFVDRSHSALELNYIISERRMLKIPEIKFSERKKSLLSQCFLTSWSFLSNHMDSELCHLCLLALFFLCRCHLTSARAGAESYSVS